MADALPSDGSQDHAELISSAGDTEAASAQHPSLVPREGEPQGIASGSPPSGNVETDINDTNGDAKLDRPVDAEIEKLGELQGEGHGDGEDEEVGECGFCLFMKSGPCRDSFIAWEECVEQAEKGKEDMVEKCHKVTFLLKECMEQNADYYEPVLQAERAMGEEAEAEAAQRDAEEESPPPSDASDQPLTTIMEDQHPTEAVEADSPQLAKEQPSSE